MSITTDKIVKAAQECGGTLKEPYDYGAKPDSLIMSFDALEKFTQHILDLVNKEQSSHTNTIHTFGYNDKGEVVVRGARGSDDPQRDHRIAECALMFREAVVVRKQTNIDPFVLWEHIMGFKWEKPIDMILYCPNCGMKHVDAEEPLQLAPPERPDLMVLGSSFAGEMNPFRWKNPPHRSHLCHNPECRCIWRPADVPTNGVDEIQTEGKADTWLAKHNDEVVAALAKSDDATPGPWFVRKLERKGNMVDCFVAAPDRNGFAYDAEILGDDEYRDGIARKLADCELIVAAVNGARASVKKDAS